MPAQLAVRLLDQQLLLAKLHGEGKEMALWKQRAGKNRMHTENDASCSNGMVHKGRNCQQRMPLYSYGDCSQRISGSSVRGGVRVRWGGRMGR